MDAIVGHTGFVGANICSHMAFDRFYNSKNFKEMRGHTFDLMVCCGVSAVKWWANQNSKADWDNINSLLEILQTIEVKNFVLISTVDVFHDPIEKTEDSLVNTEKLLPYGLHRFKVEEQIKRLFEKVFIIRLPGLFGDGLKKNIIYDLMNDNMVNQINTDSVFQWYPLHRLTMDMAHVLEKDIRLIHFATQPIRTSELMKHCFNKNVGYSDKENSVVYDIKTKFSNILEGRDGYLLDKEQVFSEIKSFISSSKKQRTPK
ncbi:hypothetical protein [Aestuariibacter salexigens]|uniref:hypothetical protein n=1 Tax=Aestuariibacter salexigens TaxID=226010 RepID=UPI0003FC26FA|nr:hypothetical protein [Aestuariibacter salexigens]